MTHTIDHIPPVELAPGFTARILHSDRMTVAFVSVEAGSILPEHQHPHEQITNVLSGTIELTVDGIPHILQGGMSIIIPGDIRHSGKAITYCDIVDVFQPVREDLRYT